MQVRQVARRSARLTSGTGGFYLPIIRIVNEPGTTVPCGPRPPPGGGGGAGPRSWLILYGRADWQWALNGGASLSHGWKPETGFLPDRWTGYDEGLLLYLLGLGSPTFPLPEESYAAYCSYKWKTIYGRELLYSGPLFTHQLSHLWIDFRDLRDVFMREHGTDYFQNSRQATYVHQEYAIRNPLELSGYGEFCWGITATDGPGWEKRIVNGIERQFYDYYARGPYGPDDGILAPWVAVAI